MTPLYKYCINCGSELQKQTLLLGDYICTICNMIYQITDSGVAYAGKSIPKEKEKGEKL